MMIAEKNRINSLFEEKENILSIYFTAGFPQLDDTVKIITELEAAGVDLIEIGMPYSDPLADGPVIQDSSTIALANGMSISKLFEQLHEIRKHCSIPLILMGYLNPVMQFGVIQFLDKCVEVGIDGTIIPDLPIKEFDAEYMAEFEARNLSNIFLITPQTTTERIKKIDAVSNSFIYMVSSYSTTGKEVDFQKQEAYYNRIKEMNLSNPTIIGFGIKDAQTFSAACNNAQGGIIGSAFVKHLKTGGVVKDFIGPILG